MNLRSEIAARAADSLERAASTLAQYPATVGFDGFVDEIISLVDKRYDFEHFDAITRIDQFAEKVHAAAGRSSNFEMVVKQIKLGGNGPIMANALAAIGLPVTYLGNVGYPEIHPVFQELATRAKVHSIAEPGHTDALEFEDGKLMMGKVTPVLELTWENMKSRIGLEPLIEAFEKATLFASVNWTMIPFMNGIWDGIVKDVMPKVTKRPRTLFVDLADPEKRTDEDKKELLHKLVGFESDFQVILGLNLKESVQIARVLGIPTSADPEASIQGNAAKLRDAIGIHGVVIHTLGAAAANVGGETGWFAGPLVREPKISTGGGDHFNAGFCAAHILGMTVEESLCVGKATSGYYVRTAVSPNPAQLADFLRNLPEPE